MPRSSWRRPSKRSWTASPKPRPANISPSRPRSRTRSTTASSTSCTSAPSADRWCCPSSCRSRPVARRAASAKRRGATPAMEPRIRDEIGAIAVLAFALLSTVALATDQGAVLQWWRSALFAFLGWAAWLVPLALGAIALELWFGFVRRETVLPILGGLVIVVALLGLTRHYVRDDVAGGYVGGAVAKAAAALFGQIGAPVALGAILLVGLVIAANRTIADMLRPAWRQRQAIAALRPGTLIPAGTATSFDRVTDDEDEEEPRTCGHALRAQTCRGREGVAYRGARGRPRARARGAHAPHRGADPREERRRHRDSQHGDRFGLAARRRGERRVQRITVEADRR